MITRIRAFGAFAYDFVVGDDWRVAIAVVLALLITYLLSAATIAAWWMVPATVVVVLPVSLWRARRRD
ncbi:MAG: hypothetical protein ACRDRL_05805 [Sciscionella sp.]